MTKLIRWVITIFYAGLGTGIDFGGQVNLDCRSVEMPTYTVCIPRAWYVQQKVSSGVVGTCNRPDGKCTGTGGGFPLPGVVFIFIHPVDIGLGYTDAHEVVQKAPQFEAPVIERVELPGASGRGRQCWVSRALAFGKVWNDIYGLRVGSKLMMASAQYNNETAKISSYRAAITKVLSSISPEVSSKPE